MTMIIVVPVVPMLIVAGFWPLRIGSDITSAKHRTYHYNNDRHYYILFFHTNDFMFIVLESVINIFIIYQ